MYNQFVSGYISTSDFWNFFFCEHGFLELNNLYNNVTGIMQLNNLYNQLLKLIHLYNHLTCILFVGIYLQVLGHTSSSDLHRH